MDQQPQQAQQGQRHPGQPYPQQGFQQQAYPQNTDQPYGQAMPYYQQRPADELGKRPASATFAAIIFVVVSALGLINTGFEALMMVAFTEFVPNAAEQMYDAVNEFDRTMMVVRFILTPICLVVGIMLFGQGKVRHRLALLLTFLWVVMIVLQPILGTDPNAIMDAQEGDTPEEFANQMDAIVNITLIVQTVIFLGIQGAIIGCLLHARRWYDEA